jgi:hypothetical protein
MQPVNGRAAQRRDQLRGSDGKYGLDELTHTQYPSKEARKRGSRVSFRNTSQAAWKNGAGPTDAYSQQSYAPE